MNVSFITICIDSSCVLVTEGWNHTTYPILFPDLRCQRFSIICKCIIKQSIPLK